jgi:hypothetical protein
MKSTLLAALFAFEALATTKPDPGLIHEFSVGVGVARLEADEKRRLKDPSTGHVNLRFDLLLSRFFFAGGIVDLSATYCPVCENVPQSELATASTILGARFAFGPLYLQAGAGLGFAQSDGVILVNFPVLSKIAYRYDFQHVGIGLGLEAKHHLNTQNKAFVISAPILIAF